VAAIRSAAEMGLAAEDCQHDRRGHAEPAIDRVERAAIAVVDLAGLAGEPFDRWLFEIIRRRRDELRLSGAGPLRAARQDEIGQCKIGFEPACRYFKCGA